MIFTFDYTITRDDDEFDIEVTYDGAVHRGYGLPDDYDIDIISVTRDGEPFEGTAQEEGAIVQACVDRLEDDLADAADDEADYRYDMMREFEYD